MKDGVSKQGMGPRGAIAFLIKQCGKCILWLQPGEPSIASADRDRLSRRSPQLPEEAPHLLDEQLWLLEGGEMPAFHDFIPIEEL